MLLSVSEVAEKLGVSKQTVWRWIREGKLKVVKLPSGRYRIPSEELEKVIG